MKTFMVVAGSNCDFPQVLDAAEQADKIILTGGYAVREITRKRPHLIAKSLGYFNLFNMSRFEGKDHDLQPSPQRMGHGKRPLVWSAEGYGSHAYDLTDSEWPGAWSGWVARALRELGLAGVFLDDWFLQHLWWTGMHDQHYADCHPENLHLFMAVAYDEIMKAANECGKIVLCNGDFHPYHHPRPTRYWERFGYDGKWNTLGIWMRARKGDYIYSSTENENHNHLAKVVSGLRNCHVGIGRPDGKPMVVDGRLMVPSPEEY